MSSTQKALKVISAIAIVLGAITTALGLLTLVVGIGWRSTVSNPADVVGSLQYGFGGLAIAFGSLILIGSIFCLVFGILGLRGAKDPSKIGPFYVLAIIGLVLTAIGVLGAAALLVASGLGVASIALYGFPLAFMIACVCLARDIKKIRDGRT